jgi:hypothetical protein
MLPIAIIASVVVLLPFVLLLAYAATRPGTLVVSRSAQVFAPPEAIFPLINDFHRWVAWSPYEKKDLTMKRTLSGAERGVGAKYAWDGNQEIGAGSMEIMESSPPGRIAIQLSFTRPMKGENDVVFTLEPAGNETKVTWTMRGKSTFMTKIIGLVINLDKMIGNDFEAGLRSLKGLAEQETKQPAGVA